ncbi:MAG: CapA family protein [Oscillospiraceae bacterium]|jgi:poly-gamma-glutamate synthesis protein (capsule biosynthesis protein)|nr:CapA family protein [Oscillospiraceae bacterium]
MITSFCASGDLMMLEPFPHSYDYKPVSDFLATSDIKITNLESVFSNWDCFASSYCGGQWVNAKPEILREINKFGFNMYSCANNHSMDYSFDGLLSTMQELHRRKMKYAGIGANLTDASKAAIYNISKKNKKVALISITSTFIDAARAGYENADVPGRPGINPLRVQTVFKVSSSHMQTLRTISEKTFINGERDNARKIGSLPPEEKGCFNFGGLMFQENKIEGKYTYCNKQDLKRVVNEIEKTCEYADYVFVSIHAHQIKYNAYTDPDYFMEEFCRACINAGATAVIGCGTHQLQPIEIYNGKPIFYSLGNFIFQLHKITKLPADFWDKYNIPTDYSVSEALAIRNKNGNVGLENDIKNYLSVIPYMEFDNDDMVKLFLKPIDLNFDNDNIFKGLPTNMHPHRAELLTDHLNEISRCYGVSLRFDGEHIIYK